MLRLMIRRKLACPVLAACFLLVSLPAFAQKLTVAVTPFEVRGGFTQGDADVIYELFITDLVSSNAVKVVDRNSFDKIMEQLKFQSSDWSDGNKVAQLGKALNADSIIRGQLMTLAGKLIITAGVLDINTAQILSTSRLQLNSIDELFDKIPGFVQGMVKNLPKPEVTKNLPILKATNTIGDRGPGGGIIFFAEGGTYMECSGNLGKTTWSEAKKVAKNYRGGGYSNWHLPTPRELDLMYKSLSIRGLVEGSSAWTDSSDNPLRAWVQSLDTGSKYTIYKDHTGSVWAVRAF